jgi:toxin-antitoxin system PIN domain toxin
MPNASTDLPDLNVWIALADHHHVHHERARRYWNEEAGPQLAFCRVTMLGLLRLGTNPRVMAGEAYTPAERWEVYRSFRALPEVTFLMEPSGLERRMATWSDRPDFAPRAWTDCYLASLACLLGCRLVSLDGDFSRFDGLDFLHLRP